MQKSRPKKWAKMWPLEPNGVGKWGQNGLENQGFSWRVLVGSFCGNRRFTAIKRWFGRIQGSRNLCKSMKNACENWVRKRYAELNENGATMEPKWTKKVTRNRDKIGKNEKKCMQKVRPQIDAEKGQRRNDAMIDRRSHFGRPGGGG